MALQIKMAPVVGDFKLELADPSGETTVRIRQATQGDMIELENLFADQTQVWENASDSAIRVNKKWNFLELKRHRVWRCLVDCNIQRENEDGELEPWFTFRVGKNQETSPGPKSTFFNEWNALPPEIAEEIYQYVLEMNPQWNPFMEGE